MFDRLPRTRKIAMRLFAFLSLAWMAACSVPGTLGVNQNTGQRIDPNAPVQVALLVPGGSGQGTDSLLAANLENAARLAIADLRGVNIDLRVYNTGADPLQAAQVASAAVDDGAKIILGPLFAEAANAAGVSVANRNVNVLAFSNNAAIAGGNVFILGATFDNTARRLVQYSARQGLNRVAIVHGNDIPGQVGRDAIANAVRANGGQVTTIEGYPLTQAGIEGRAAGIAAAVQAGGSDAVFLTGGVNADLPVLARVLPEAGLSPTGTRYVGITRWDTAPGSVNLPGGLFAMPDQGPAQLFQSRYAAAYGSQPHVLAGLAYDGIAAIGALVAQGNANALTKSALTARQGFQGTSGIFRFLPNGLNERGLAVATIRNNQVVILEPAQRSFGGSGL